MLTPVLNMSASRSVCGSADAGSSRSSVALISSAICVRGSEVASYKAPPAALAPYQAPVAIAPIAKLAPPVHGARAAPAVSILWSFITPQAPRM